MSATSMIKSARYDLGMREPNAIQRWYARRNGSAYNYNFAWCDAAITEWAVKSDNYAAVCFGTDYAYTVWHADRFRDEGRWHRDVKGIRAGDIVFFDWSGSNNLGAIDHVGLVEYVKGSAVHTIEGNTGNRCRRRVRDRSTIVGYGRPNYKGDDMPSAREVAEAVWRHNIPSGHKDNPEWWAQNFIRNIETGQDAVGARTAEILAAVTKIAEQVGAPVDLDEAELAKQILAGLAQMPDQVAQLVLDSLGPEVATKVVDELGTRLQEV